MIGVGAGLALAGRMPFACSFACFVVGRFETIRVSVAYTKRRVKLVGHPRPAWPSARTATPRWAWRTSPASARCPNIPIVQPADELETKQAVAFAVEHPGPLYLRLTRQNLEPVARRRLSLPVRPGRGAPPGDAT